MVKGEVRRDGPLDSDHFGQANLKTPSHRRLERLWRGFGKFSSNLKLTRGRPQFQ